MLRFVSRGCWRDTGGALCQHRELSPALSYSAWWLLQHLVPAARAAPGCGSQQRSWVLLWRFCNGMLLLRHLPMNGHHSDPHSNLVASPEAQHLPAGDFPRHPRELASVKSHQHGIASALGPLSHPVSHAMSSSARSGPQPEGGDLCGSSSTAL